MDWDAVLYDPIYSALGVPAVLAFGTDEFDLTVIDKTKGELVDGHVGVQTIKPCADVRMAELTANDIDLDLIPDGTLAMNGKTWRVETFAYRPGPSGERSGEVRMTLMEQNV